MLQLRPITETIGTEISGIDVTGPLSAKEFDRIYEAWIDTTILLFRGQSMSQEQHLGFSRRFGPLVSFTREKFAEAGHAEILVLSNIMKDGRPIGSPVSGRVWHTDGHFLAEPPAGSILYALECPTSGGDTWFANMFAAYEELPETVKTRIAPLKAWISRVKSRPYNYPDRPPPTEAEKAEWKDVSHPLVRVHPENGRKALYVGGNVPWAIEGMATVDSAPLITFLQEFSVRPRFTYRHRLEARRHHRLGQSQRDAQRRHLTIQAIVG